MKFRIACVIFLFAWFSPLSANVDVSPFSQKMLDKQSGSYTISVDSKFYTTTKSVAMEFYIPKSLSNADLSKIPLIVFFHGNTRKLDYYNKDTGFMKQKAEQYKFILLCPQQWWSLSGGNTSGAGDSRKAVNLVLNKLKDKDLFDPQNVYVTGFSAGGFAAFLTVMDSLNHFSNSEYEQQSRKNLIEYMKMENQPIPENLDVHEYRYKDSGGIDFNEFDYRGFASFKGNFYNGIMDLPMEIEDWQAHYIKIFKDKLAFICVGGTKDATRVKTQAPEMNDFMSNYLSLKTVFKQYPKEAHNLSKANWDDFYSQVKQRLKH